MKKINDLEVNIGDKTYVIEVKSEKQELTYIKEKLPVVLRSGHLRYLWGLTPLPIGVTKG